MEIPAKNPFFVMESRNIRRTATACVRFTHSPSGKTPLPPPQVKPPSATTELRKGKKTISCYQTVCGNGTRGIQIRFQLCFKCNRSTYLNHEWF